MSISNATGSIPGPEPREALLAFDALPKPLRERLAHSPAQIDPTDLIEWYRMARRQNASLEEIIEAAEISIAMVEAQNAAEAAEHEKQIPEIGKVVIESFWSFLGGRRR